ncbi:unnamed protein product [Ectocarpus sp. 12 AP-2014]
MTAVHAANVRGDIELPYQWQASLACLLIIVEEDANQFHLSGSPRHTTNLQPGQLVCERLSTAVQPPWDRPLGREQDIGKKVASNTCTTACACLELHRASRRDAKLQKVSKRHVAFASWPCLWTKR